MSRIIEKELLLELRSKLSFESRTKHSWSFSDTELASLLDARPKTIEELGSIKGFPIKGKRVAAYGEAITEIFNGKSIKGFDVKISDSGDDLTVKSLFKRSSAF